MRRGRRNARERLVSITFDDGFRSAAEAATPILERFCYAATFYLVTGWVKPERARISEAYNVGRCHGDWPFWQNVSLRGHEIGSHGFSHMNARGKVAAVAPWLLTRDIRRSFEDIRRQVPHDEYTISMPWNASSAISQRAASAYFSGCVAGDSAVRYNNLSDLDRYSVQAWAPESSHAQEDYRIAIEGIPDRGWLVFQFHSFDQEGWEPITTSHLAWMCELLKRSDVCVTTVRDALQRAK
jgi:peptidoglycan/xylan/chitin deacetylase (PgdA/CDA1 family)